jgi:protein ImuB
MMRRVMCVWCPLWPVQRLLSEQPELEGLATAATAAKTSSAIDSATSPITASGSLTNDHVPSQVPSRKAASTNSPSRGPARPIILFAESPRGLFVTACSYEAIQAGIRMGMPLGEARSLLPGTARSPSMGGSRRQSPKPFFHRADPAADRARLQQLALHCQRYSALVGLEEGEAPESLWLDLAGNELLFGGERSLLDAVRADLAQQGFQARIAIADTWGAAWAVSHFDPSADRVVPPGQHAEALAPLPVTALRVPTAAVELLQTLDVSTIGRLMRLPRTALPSRFGKDLLRRLDQALGQAPEMLTAEKLIEPLFAEWLFDEPVAARQTLEHVLGTLLDQLLGQLQHRQAGLRELNVRWLGSTAEPVSLRLLRPTTDRRHLFELLRLQCERRVFTAGLGGIRLELVEMGLPPIKQALLFEDQDAQVERHQQALAELVDRLGSRLGRRSVLRPVLRPDPQPEHACECVPWPGESSSPAPMAVTSDSQLRCRPLSLLTPPQPLTIETSSRDPGGPIREGIPRPVSRVSGRLFQPSVVILQITGPERIETGWWRGPDARRDYYRLDLANGAALWAFVDRNTGHWFLHGLFV